MIITRTPYRVSFFGGGTDYPSWYREHKGLVIGTSFACYCYVSCRRLPPFFSYKTRAVYSQMESVSNNQEIQHPAIRGCLQHLNIEEGLEIHHDGDLPARSGLGSSSAFTVGFLQALHGMRHEMPTKRQLADEAIHVEQKVLKENVGIQDQILAAHGGFQAIEIGPEDQYQLRPILLPENYRQEFQNHLLLGFTGLTRIASQIAEAQVKKIEKGESQMSEVFSIAKEALTFFQNKTDFDNLGKLLHDSWLLKRSLSADISNSFIDEIYETAIRAGAIGGKILGAGGGGFILFLAPPSRHEKIKQALSEIKVWVPFRFENEGAQVIFHNDHY